MIHNRNENEDKANDESEKMMANQLTSCVMYNIISKVTSADTTIIYTKHFFG